MSGIRYVARRPYTMAYPIVPEDGVNFKQGECDAIWGAVGDVVAAGTRGGISASFTIGGDGILEVKARRVDSTGTTSAGLVALYYTPSPHR